MKFICFAVDNDGVTSIGSALISDDYVGIFGQKVGNLRLAFVSKLRSDNNYVSQGLISPN